MSKTMEITVIRADTNQEFDVELPVNMSFGDLIPSLIRELNLPVSSGGNTIAYELSNKRTGMQLKEKESLESTNTKEGDVVLLTSTFVAG